VTAAQAVLVAASAAAVALTASACGARVGQKDLETKVSQFVNRQTGIDVRVACPKDLHGKKGEHFTCTTSLAGQTTDLDFEFSHDGRFRLLGTRQ
jgi:hypothetical protein